MLCVCFFTLLAIKFPDDALGPEFAVKPRIDADTAAFHIQACATFSADPGFVFLADCGCFAIGVDSTLHRFSWRVVKYRNWPELAR